MTTTTIDSLRNSILDFVEPNQIFTLQELIKRVSNPWDSCYDGRTDDESKQSCVRRDLQLLRDEDFISFIDNDGTYRLNCSKKIDPNENIFSLELLEKHGRILGWNDKTQTTSAEGITFKKWMIADKDEVMSHSIARELGIPCQTRVGKATFLETINEIEDNILNVGYEYHAYQPAISELSKPISYNGHTYKYIVRDGNNRYELKWKKFPCALIEGENEYSLLQFGAMANNPNTSKKNDITANDVKYMIKLGFDHNMIEKNMDSVLEVLKTKYKDTRKGDRRIFAQEILADVDVKDSIEEYNASKAKKHLLDPKHYGVEFGDYDLIMGWGRPLDHPRNFWHKFKMRLEHPDADMVEYSFLSLGSGVTTQPTAENIRELRINFESENKKYINHCCDIADAHRSGQLKPIHVKWLSQVNDNNQEKYNEFQ